MHLQVPLRSLPLRGAIVALALGGALATTTVPALAKIPARSAPVVGLTLRCEAFEALPVQEHALQLPVVADLAVTVCSNASTGFVWGDPEISDPAVVALVDAQAEPPASPMPGAAGTQSWSFKAQAAGTVHIHLSYGQPWEGGEKDAWTFDLDVTVS